MATKKQLHIYLISDGTGETAESMLNAALIQFKNENVNLKKHYNVVTKKLVKEALDAASKVNAIIIYTIVSKELEDTLVKEAEKHKMVTVSLLGPLLSALSEFLEAKPEFKSGLLRQIDDSYLNRLEAINFTVKHDDGVGLKNLKYADIILVGVSRTTKTPLSIYLSYKGYKVANIPLVYGIDLPEELFKTSQKKICGLIMELGLLMNVRQERLKMLNQPIYSGYADLDYVSKELKNSRKIFRSSNWPVVDITGKSIEEAAAEIISYLNV